MWTAAGLCRLVRDLGLAPDRSARIVDLGCGWGGLGLALALTHPRLKVLGLDLDDTLLTTGRDVARSVGLHRRVQFRQDDVQDLDVWAEPPPAAVVCQALLVHMPRPLVWLREVASRLPPGSSIGLVEADPVLQALGLRDSVTDPDPAYRQFRVEVAEAVVEGARTLGVDRRIGSRLTETLTRAGFVDVGARVVGQAPIDSEAWLRRRLQRRLAEEGDPVERHLAIEGGLSADRYEVWIRRQRVADRERLAALQRGDYGRREGGGSFVGWGRV